MNRIRLKDKEFELFIPESKIKEAIRHGCSYKEDIKGTDPLFVGVLNGAFMFAAELMKELNGPYQLTFALFIHKGTSSSGEINEIMPIQVPVEGRTGGVDGRHHRYRFYHGICNE